MQAEVEDENGKHRLTPGELGSFFLLLVVAGNETTRNAISHGMRALTEHPDQRKLWTADFDGVSPTAVEEIVRWATPVIHFRRTATRDAVVGGQEIKAGEKVVMFYNSANRDERAFADPFRFDVPRTPNEHFGFGAGGPHFCLGANLARREIRVMFEELFRRLPDIEITGEPDMLQSNFIHGIKRMPCAWHTVHDCDTARSAASDPALDRVYIVIMRIAAFPAQRIRRDRCLSPLGRCGSCPIHRTGAGSARSARRSA